MVLVKKPVKFSQEEFSKMVEENNNRIKTICKTKDSFYEAVKGAAYDTELLYSIGSIDSRVDKICDYLGLSYYNLEYWQKCIIYKVIKEVEETEF